MEDPKPEDLEVIQSFTIRIKHHPAAKDENGNPAPPEWFFEPAGPAMSPTDVVLMCTEGIRWATLGAELARQQRRDAKLQGVPVGGGRNRIIRVN